MSKNEVEMLPGFDNIQALQLDDERLMLALHTGNDDHTVPCVVIDRSDYDSDQEFVQECRQWARNHGGVATTPHNVAAAVAQESLRRVIG